MLIVLFSLGLYSIGYRSHCHLVSLALGKFLFSYLLMMITMMTDNRYIDSRVNHANKCDEFSARNKYRAIVGKHINSDFITCII